MEYMNKIVKLPELLAPAGSFEHLKAAVKAGADAVYMGGHQFGARAYADNFSPQEIIDAIHYAHFYDTRLYLTVNTLMKEKELQEKLYGFLKPYYEAGLDGVIVQDPGTASFIRTNFPDMEIHGSTQMTVTDVYGAKAVKRLGMCRVVPARELSLNEIVRIKKETGLEIEIFIHGALCYCYSGQCLLSSMYGGRSGNRGRCAQPCRQAYELYDSSGNSLSGRSCHLLSPKDLCAIKHLPSLIDAGVDSLKIEGRMKNVEYVAGVTAIYRKYLDRYQEMMENKMPDQWKVEEQDYNYLEELYSRSGFTDGYLNRHNGKGMMSVDHPKNLGRKIGKILSVSGHQIRVSLQDEVHPKDVLIVPLNSQEEVALTVPAQKQSREITLNVPSVRGMRKGMWVYRRKNTELSRWIQENVLGNERKYPVFGQITLSIGRPAELSLKCKGKEIHVTGEKVERSDKRPVTREDILRQMNKTGAVPFYLEELEIHLEPDSFFPISFLKNMRQQGYEVLKNKLECSQDRMIAEETKKIKEKVSYLNTSIESRNDQKEKIAWVYDEAILQKCVSEPFFDSICLPADLWSPDSLRTLAEEIFHTGKKVYLSLPRILRMEDQTISVYEVLKKICLLDIWSGIYVHNIGEAQFLYEYKGRKAPIISAASFYRWNGLAGSVMDEMFDLSAAQLPAELSLKECEQMAEASESVLPLEWMIYGRIPVMISAQCLKKTTGRCDHQPSVLWMEDLKKRRLPVSTHCDGCYNTIWLDKPQNIIGEEIGLLKNRIQRFSFNLFQNHPGDIDSVISSFLHWEQGGFHREEKKKKPEEHWNNGVE